MPTTLDDLSDLPADPIQSTRDLRERLVGARELESATLRHCAPSVNYGRPDAKEEFSARRIERAEERPRSPYDLRERGGSWVERLRARAAEQPEFKIGPEMARRLRRQGVPDALIARLPAAFEHDAWFVKLAALPGSPHGSHEYVSTRLVFVALGERPDGNTAKRLAQVMCALGWRRCKLYPHLGFGRKVVRGYKRPLCER
jgi:hypothetical protein